MSSDAGEITAGHVTAEVSRTRSTVSIFRSLSHDFDDEGEMLHGQENWKEYEDEMLGESSPVAQPPHSPMRPNHNPEGHQYSDNELYH